MGYKRSVTHEAVVPESEPINSSAHSSQEAGVQVTLPDTSLMTQYMFGCEAAAHLLDPEVFHNLPKDMQNELLRIGGVDQDSDDPYGQLVTKVNTQMVRMGQAVQGKLPFQK